MLQKEHERDLKLRELERIKQYQMQRLARQK